MRYFISFIHNDNRGVHVNNGTVERKKKIKNNKDILEVQDGIKKKMGYENITLLFYKKM